MDAFSAKWSWTKTVTVGKRSLCFDLNLFTSIFGSQSRTVGDLFIVTQFRDKMKIQKQPSVPDPWSEGCRLVEAWKQKASSEKKGVHLEISLYSQFGFTLFFLLSFQAFSFPQTRVCSLTSVKAFAVLKICHVINAGTDFIKQYWKPHHSTVIFSTLLH